MDIWVNPVQENKIRKLGFTIPERPGRGKVFYENEEVGFIDDFIGIRIDDNKTNAVIKLLDNEEALKLCIWNPPSIERASHG